MPSLLDPIRVGDLELPNRIFMSPLTRLRGTVDHVHRPELGIPYYSSRASAGLIISEGTPIAPLGVGYERVPGLWNDAQVEAWKPIVESVHAAGGRIFAQIWHVGRVSHPDLLHGELPVAPSAIAPEGNVSVLRPAREYVTPHALTTGEVEGVVEQFRQGAVNAKAAGFDGVELHGANGYLLDQFLQTNSNKREDRYGGSVENRARLHLECTDAAIGVFGAGRVGMHLAPRRDVMSMGDDTPAETFGYLAEKLGERKIAFILTREYVADDSLSPMMKTKFGGVYIANERFTPETAEAYVEGGHADGVAFGKLYVANPDLVERIRAGAAPKKYDLNEYDKDTFYTHEAAGYTDYPTLADAKQR